jgi:hypothetical protein
MSGSAKISQSLPRSAAYMQRMDCHVCNIRAKLIYTCKKCGAERKYCGSYVCQAEDWDSHQLQCNVETGASEVLEDTLIKHVSGGLSWSRSRKISISTSDIMEAVRSVSKNKNKNKNKTNPANNLYHDAI